MRFALLGAFSPTGTDSAGASAAVSSPLTFLDFVREAFAFWDLGSRLGAPLVLPFLFLGDFAFPPLGGLRLLPFSDFASLVFLSKDLGKGQNAYMGTMTT